MNLLPDTSVFKGASAAMEVFNASQTAAATLAQYTNVYTIPFILSASYFNRVEMKRFWSRSPSQNLLAYLKLATMNMKLTGRAVNGEIQAIDQFLTRGMQALAAALAGGKSEALANYINDTHRLLKQLAYTYPAAIRGIENEFGFHFERQPASSRIAETDRYILYEVLPNDPKVKPRANGKPVLIIPPSVLGANILAFLPMEKRSYAHAFANQGIPTYIRILKDIKTNEAVQVMSPEDDTRDMRRFCEVIKTRHGIPVTLNGYCQGGFAALCNLLSGELDGLVDAFLTCVSPMDGSRGQGLPEFLSELPEEFNDLAYGTKILPNGNKVADGTLMGWIYKLKSIESESPLLSMWRDMMLVSKSNGDPVSINKTAAALNYWLIYDRNDLPIEKTRMSFDSYNTPISKDGTLPVKLFGRTLNIKRMQEKKIPWLICYGKQDDLVNPASALAPLDYVDAEVTGYPKGHVAIATSWSHPNSAYALHQRYSESTRGPVRFQLDLQQAIDRASSPVKARAKNKKAIHQQAAAQRPSRSKAGSNPKAPPKAPIDSVN